MHEQRHRRLERRSIERIRDADAELRREDRPQRAVLRHEVGDRDRQDHRRALHRQLQLLLRDAVGEHAGRDRQHQQGAELREDHQAHEGGAAGAVVDVGGQREVLHPRTDVRQRQTDEDDPESPVRQGRPGGAGLAAVIGRCVEFGCGGHRGRALDPRVKLAHAPGSQRNWRKQVLMSSTNSSGTSNAAKWPPFGCSFQ